MTASTAPLLNRTQLDSFDAELRAIRARVDTSLGEEDLRHLRKIELWGRAAGLLGWLTAWLMPNPLSAALLSVGRSTRWLLMHHVAHRGYDRVPGVPKRLTSKHYARGWRRFVDWLDWILPDAWTYEHNVLHHSHTGEEKDPDLLERNAEYLRNAPIPRWLRYLAMFGLALTWRALYYAPRTLDVFLPVSLRGRTVEPGARTFALWLRCYAPYAATYFIVAPLLFTPLGGWAVLSVLINSILADIFTSVHTFIVVGPNHTGEDLYRFDSAPQSRGEHYLRQVLGSTNYRVGGDALDFAHLWLNYQIEHHLFPDIPMLRYREVQPEVKALCARYGIPYVQESVWRRLWKLLDVTTGRSSMRRWNPPQVEEAAGSLGQVAAR